MSHHPDPSLFRYAGNRCFDPAAFDCAAHPGLEDKDQARKCLQKNIKCMMDQQGKLYAEDRRSLLLILQAMDAAGKDGIIKHVMEGLNPQGTEVHSFKQPSAEELDHDFLWRIHKRVPERGRIGIFNRSHYEDVLVVRVHGFWKRWHPEAIDHEAAFWGKRFRQIRDFEQHLAENGTEVIKVFLHVSKDEQKHRFLDRLEDPAKNWKFSEADLRERGFWNAYQEAYREAIEATATDHAPWYVVPADHKWYARALVSQILADTMEAMSPTYPALHIEQKARLDDCKQQLLSESGD
jgi:PPK2 family polyphosphate:nucleotide phosphotransferase